MSNNVISIEDRIPKLKEQRKKKVNRRLILILSLFFILIMIIVYFQSPLSKVGAIQITGSNYTDIETIKKVSGITKETSILNIDSSKIQSDIEALAEIKTATTEIKFPNKILINIEEYERVGYLYKDDRFYQLLENGEAIQPNNDEGLAFSGPILKNFSNGELLNLASTQLKKLPVEVKNAISEIIYTPKKTDQYSIVAYMNDGYEVRATMRTFADKMKHYPAIVQQLNTDIKGIIDLEVGYFFQSYQAQEQQLQIESGEESES